MTLPIQYAEQPPPDALAEVVRSLWSFSASATLAPGLFTLPPDPCLSLSIVRIRGRLDVRIVGPHLRPLEVPIGPGSRVRGIRYRPEAAGLGLGLDPRDWPDRNASAKSVAPGLVAAVRACATEDAGQDVVLDALIEGVASAPPPDALVRRAVEKVETVRGELRMSELASDLGVSLRTLQRRFVAATGVAPKSYARVRRFLLAVGSNVARNDADPWGRVAAEFGYADQAHFVRECHALTGVSPTAYAERMAPIRHVGVRP